MSKAKEKLFEIKHRYSGEVIFKTKATSLEIAVETAIMMRADLREADLREADLREADLWGANLRGADLRGANLCGVNLWGANLRGVNLWGANLRGETIYSAPDFLTLQPYQIMIYNSKIEIGCELHSLKEWRGFSDNEIIEMDGQKALSWWKQYKTSILSIANTQAKKAKKAKAEFDAETKGETK